MTVDKTKAVPCLYRVKLIIIICSVVVSGILLLLLRLLFAFETQIMSLKYKIRFFIRWWAESSDYLRYRFPLFIHQQDNQIKDTNNTNCRSTESVFRMLFSVVFSHFFHSRLEYKSFASFGSHLYRAAVVVCHDNVVSCFIFQFFFIVSTRTMYCVIISVKKKIHELSFRLFNDNVSFCITLIISFIRTNIHRAYPTENVQRVHCAPDFNYFIILLRSCIHGRMVWKIITMHLSVCVLRTESVQGNR